MNISFFFRQYIKKPLYEKWIMLDYSEKRALIKEYRDIYKSTIFVETGSLLGDTAFEMKSHFEMVHTIELQEDLANKCKERFKNSSNVKVYNGNSADVLKGIMPQLTNNTLFWLDAHYSSQFVLGGTFVQTAKGEKETPIMEELETILKNGLNNSVILIDDARQFVGKNDYPSIRSLKSLLLKKGVKANQIKVKRDVIRIVPN